MGGFLRREPLAFCLSVCRLFHALFCGLSRPHLFYGIFHLSAVTAGKRKNAAFFPVADVRFSFSEHSLTRVCLFLPDMPRLFPGEPRPKRERFLMQYKNLFL